MSARFDRPPEDIPTGPCCPMLSASGLVLFGMVVSSLQSMGIASSAYTAMITLLALRLEKIEQCNEEIRQNGRVYTKYELIAVPGDDGRIVTKAQKIPARQPQVQESPRGAVFLWRLRGMGWAVSGCS